ncbi:MAG: hypothetical protein ACRDRI_10020 [Pseudonocardiaceae bacterium]
MTHIVATAVVDGYEAQARFARAETDTVPSPPLGVSLHTTAVELSLFSANELVVAFTTAGFSQIRFLPGHGGPSEILGQADSGDLR